MVINGVNTQHHSSSSAKSHSSGQWRGHTCAYKALPASSPNLTISLLIPATPQPPSTPTTISHLSSPPMASFSPIQTVLLLVNCLLGQAQAKPYQPFSVKLNWKAREIEIDERYEKKD